MTVMRSLMVLLLALWPFMGAAQEAEFQELVEDAAAWAEEHIDPSVLEALSIPEESLVTNFLARLQAELQGPYVLDLAALRDTAWQVEGILERYEETLPYAFWLKSRMDYFDVAKDLADEASRKGEKREPGKPNSPDLDKERVLWKKRLEQRGWPAEAKRLVPQLKPVFKAEGVPPELVWIAEVESSFQKDARSPAGAAGLFQLMPATANRFGLRTWPFDQRLDPEVSARASAKYLRFLHGKFRDWRLALAAYNAGEGTVQKALDRRKGRTFEEIAGTLPAETQLYVPKIEATLLRREGMKLDEVPAATRGSSN